jgi:hypothetical protein
VLVVFGNEIIMTVVDRSIFQVGPSEEEIERLMMLDGETFRRTP